MAMRLSSPVVALLCADIHLSYQPPVARSGEESWFAAMERPLKALRDLQEKHSCPVLCAGDVFDKWNSPPELINWAIERLPHLHAVPGNHDLPNHRPDLSYRSAYGTLVRAGRVTELGGWPLLHKGLAIYGRPWGEIVPEPRCPDLFQVLVTHQFLWVPGAGYEGAPRESRVSRKSEEFRGFDLVVSGDNHQPFEKSIRGGTQLVNMGGLMRRRTSDQHLEPRIGLLRASGAVSFIPLDTSGDRLEVGKKEPPECENSEEVESFVEALGAAGDSELDFRANVEQAMRERGTGDEVRAAVLEAMG